MKSILLFSLLLTAPASFAAGCPDISGNYEAPTNTESRQITYIYSQAKCDWLSISGVYATDSGGVSVMPTKDYVFDGKQPKDCNFSMPGTCAAYSITPAGIAKHLAQSSFADGGEKHGGCTYTDSVLTKDTSGNLVETVAATKCEDGFSGTLPPIVYPKSK